MTRSRLILRSLAFYWRTHLGVLAGTILTAAILTGALVVGDSVRHSLTQMAVARLGKTELALVSPERFFRTALADEVQSNLNTTVAPMLLWRGTVTQPDTRARANDVQVVGVEKRFWQLGATRSLLGAAESDEVVINERLANRLGIERGATVVIRMEQPSFVSRDAPLSGKADVSVVLRAKVLDIAGSADFGQFGLAANQVPPLTVFVPLPVLQEKVKRVGQVNALLAGPGASANAADAELHRHWTLADAGVEFRALRTGQGAELRTDRVFLEPAVVKPARALATNSFDVLTYFVNELKLGDRRTPYSVITAVAPRDTGFLPPDLGADEIVINSWLAEDLGAKPGDELAVRYFVMGDRRELREQSAKFRVRAIVPLTGAVADPSWMPPYPGLADAENCRDWEPGIPIDNTKIRPKDEAYWNKYRGAPKGFVTLAAGQQLWHNRFGDVTSIRYPGAETNALAAALRPQLDPAALGLFFLPVKARALAASNQAMDFGQLFIGFSFFLIIAALLLTAMLFVFNIEQRSEQVGLLRAIGFGPKLVRRLLLAEGLALVIAGTLVGMFAGTVYTKLTLHGLATVWKGAVGTMAFTYYASPATLAAGGVSSLFVALLAMWLVVRNQGKQAASALLSGSGAAALVSSAAGRWRARIGLWLGIFFLVAGVGMLFAAGKQQGPAAAETFFSAGLCLLIAGIGFSQRLLVGLALTNKLAHNVGAVGLRNAARRRGRSLTTISVLASGVFLVVAVNAFHRDPQQGAWDRASGTGGFAFWASSSLPVYEDLNGRAGREAYNLSADKMQGVAVVPMRLREGDEASCLNLNRAQQPQIWGVNPEELKTRGAFNFAEGSWAALFQAQTDGAIPAIGDQQTVQWALGLKVGDTITYTDDDGQPAKLRLVAVVSSSILQGGLLIAERDFVRHFPASSGYRAFLIDAPPDRAEAVQQTLARALEDKGLELVPTWQRLADFLAVENTYLAIFQVLGGLGLVLGSVGLGIVVLRNVLERRGELALLQAVGFQKGALRHLVLSEHWLLIVLGLVTGIVTAVLAVLPAWRAPGVQVPVGWLALTLGALAVGGLLWSWLAAFAAVRGSLLGGLRNE